MIYNFRTLLVCDILIRDLIYVFEDHMTGIVYDLLPIV